MDLILFQLDAYADQGIIDSKFHRLVTEFYHSYCAFSQSPVRMKERQKLFGTLFNLILKEKQTPHQFSIFHESLRHPFDYYQFGLDFIRPFVDFEHSRLFGLDQLKKIREQLTRGENVILLANHQIEPDPQIISLLLEKTDPALAAEMIFVAGHRVVKDPVAIPMSLGRNLLCIYSKKHVSHPPEEKSEKVTLNQRTLKKMQELLHAGGKCIYVAPSGGRDRPHPSGEFHVAPFDPQSIELFYLLGRNAEHLTHFYPLSLKTHQLMPPPCQVEKELGEKRVIHYTPVYITFGNELDMEYFPGSEVSDKKEKRKMRTDYIWQEVCKNYAAFIVD